jgi:hypothetical protein
MVISSIRPFRINWRNVTRFQIGWQLRLRSAEHSSAPHSEDSIKSNFGNDAAIDEARYQKRSCSCALDNLRQDPEATP